MHRTIRRVLSLVGVCGCFAACGDDRPPVAAFVGALCRSDLDCGGLFCVDSGGGTCEPACRGDIDCGPGFSCHDVTRHGTGGKVNVCVPN